MVAAMRCLVGPMRSTDRGDGGVVDEVMRAAGEAAGREVQFSVKPPPKAE